MSAGRRNGGESAPLELEAAKYVRAMDLAKQCGATLHISTDEIRFSGFAWQRFVAALEHGIKAATGEEAMSIQEALQQLVDIRNRDRGSWAGAWRRAWEDADSALASSLAPAQPMTMGQRAKAFMRARLGNTQGEAFAAGVDAAEAFHGIGQSAKEKQS